MEGRNEDMDIAVYDLKDFLIKNDAELEEEMTFDIIIQQRAIPTVNMRKEEAKLLLTQSVKYMEDFDYRMHEVCTQFLNLYRDFATYLDKNREKLKQTELNFQVSLASCGDKNDEEVAELEEELE